MSVDIAGAALPYASGPEPRYSLVIPVYKNEEGLPALLDAVAELDRRLSGRLEAIFVVDGSPDRCYAILHSQLPDVTFRSQLLAHSRNFGSFAAVRTGLRSARGAYLAVMAADLQEPPELVVRFFTRLETDEADVIVGTRQGRSDPWTTRLTSGAFWRLYRTLVQPDVPMGGVDVFGCSARVRDALLAFPESHTNLVGLLYWLGFRREEVSYDRLKREHGRSSWSLRKRSRYMLDSIFSFTDLPITALLVLGALGTLGSLGVSALVFLAWATGRIAVSGYTPLALMISTSTTIVLLALGLVGSYVWRAFENSKARPLSVVALASSWDGRDDE